MTPLDESYRHCQQVARAAASSFYPCFRVLPEPKRRAMCALYAFFRQTDDIADDDSTSVDDRRERLCRWREILERSLAGDDIDKISLALHDTVARYSIPTEYLTAALDGAEMDIDQQQYETIDDLLGYCYRVASCVGLACIHVWGFTDERAIQPAADCGYAFQMTNILRDIKEDAARNRVYLPSVDLRRFNYTAEELRQGTINDCYQRLIDFEMQRTAEYYDSAARLPGYLHPDGQRIYQVMYSAYHCLFGRIDQRRGDVFSRRVSLSWTERMRLAAGIYLSPALLPGR